MKYTEFLKNKKIKVDDFGFNIELKDINPMLLDFQKAVVKWAIKKGRCAVFADCGMGKGQEIGSKILTPTGWINIENLKINDEIISGQGKIQKVIGIFPKGEIDTYRFYYSDRISHVFDEDHLHICRTANDRNKKNNWKVLSTRELLSSKIRYGKGNKSRNFDIPIVKPIEFVKKELPIHPYILGVLLGDGCLKRGASFTKSLKDIEIIDKIKSLIDKDYFLSKTESEGKSISWNIIYNIKNKNPIIDKLRELNLFKLSSCDKFIPEIYLYSSIEDRLELLRGLMDTDGYIDSRSGCCQFYSTSKQLSDGVKFLLYSLGGIPTEKIKKNPKYTYNNENRIGKDCNILTYSLNTFNPFYLKRKANLWNGNSRDNGRWIDRIEFENKQKTICISVDSPDGSYVTDNFIVTHNTAIQLEWARLVHKETKGKILILAPLSVSLQTNREAKKFNIEDKFKIVRSQEECIDGINITNYEIMDKFNENEFTGIVLDESGILKSFSGKTKKELCDKFARTQYRLCCTATPSPNDHMEILNHSEFLSIMESHKALAIWFINDTMNMGKYRLKNHGREEFWKWVSSWALSIEKPSDLGDEYLHEDPLFKLPELNAKEEIIKVDMSIHSEGELFRLPALSATDYHKERKLTTSERVNRIVEIIQEDTVNQFCIWCDTNFEADQLKKMLPESTEIRGSDSSSFKEKSSMDFVDGKIRILISKPSIFGFGINFQNCHNVIFCGMSYSYESFYQAIRRFWRFGQKEKVNAWIVIGSTEKQILDKIHKKDKMYKELKKGLYSAIRKNQHLENEGVGYKMDYEKKIYESKTFKLIVGDAIEEIKNIESESIHFSIFSPPFSSLYIYSDSYRDMGNNVNDEEFFKHFEYMLPDLFRILKSGRLVAIHCKNLVDYKTRDGRAGLRDFRGDIIRSMEKCGFKYHSEVCIWKSPVTEMQRTKAHGLLYKQLRKDASYSRQGLPDYLVIFRKWGEDTEPVRHYKNEKDILEHCEKDNNGNLIVSRLKTLQVMNLDVWQRYASPVWFDVQQTKVLNCKLARSDAEEKHICPLQLDVIERAVDLWTNPEDVVFSPFAGIGSEGYSSIKLNRKFLGIELKPEYAKVAFDNLKEAEHRQSEGFLFDFNKTEKEEDKSDIEKELENLEAEGIEVE